jgi:hypothetical protein
LPRGVAAIVGTTVYRGRDNDIALFITGANGRRNRRSLTSGY